MPVRRPALALPGAILTFVFLIAGIAPTMASAEGPQVNVYMFGDSTSDPGNMPFEPSPGNQVPVSRDVRVPIFPFSPTAVGSLHLRYTPNGIPSDGENFPYFVAADFGFEFLLGSQVTSLNAEPESLSTFLCQAQRRIAIPLLSSALLVLLPPTTVRMVGRYKPFPNW